MATINLGAIKFNWKGAYNSSTSYAVDDVVSSGGNSYVCIQAHSNQAVGNATAYWNIMSSAGTNGTDVGATLANKEIAFKTNAGAVDGIPIGNAGEFLKVNSGATGYEYGTIVSKLLQAQCYEYTTRDSVSQATSDQALRTWTTGFVKQSATSKLYIWNMNPTHNSTQGSQNVYQKFTHTDGTVSQIFGSRIYQYSSNNNSTIIGMQGVATGLKAGTYTIVLTGSSNNNANNGHFILNPNGSDDNRYEYSADSQAGSRQAGSKSTIIIQEIEV